MPPPDEATHYEHLVEGFLNIIEERGYAGGQAHLMWAGVGAMIEDDEPPRPWATVELPEDETPPPARK